MLGKGNKNSETKSMLFCVKYHKLYNSLKMGKPAAFAGDLGTTIPSRDLLLTCDETGTGGAGGAGGACGAGGAAPLSR